MTAFTVLNGRNDAVENDNMYIDASPRHGVGCFSRQHAIIDCDTYRELQ